MPAQTSRERNSGNHDTPSGAPSASEEQHCQGAKETEGAVQETC